MKQELQLLALQALGSIIVVYLIMSGVAIFIGALQGSSPYTKCSTVNATKVFPAYKIGCWLVKEGE